MTPPLFTSPTKMFCPWWAKWYHTIWSQLISGKIISYSIKRYHKISSHAEPSLKIRQCGRLDLKNEILYGQKFSEFGFSSPIFWEFFLSSSENISLDFSPAVSLLALALSQSSEIKPMDGARAGIEIEKVKSYCWQQCCSTIRVDCEQIANNHQSCYHDDHHHYSTG